MRHYTMIATFVFNTLKARLLLADRKNASLQFLPPVQILSDKLNKHGKELGLTLDTKLTRL